MIFATVLFHGVAVVVIAACAVVLFVGIRDSILQGVD